ncbi:MBL fold metallo-hydrolase [Cohnella silvisoli]|uniref:MBL fold metallo-hydrolase n=1 Tax=Cohnella silvisoli TaxID=2873699 RepID=A0ABV1KTT8_9BACL|nr:MBL fold metallo-hydrolase [Cohnella silvisoli]MCD9022759.1 MBL fold metallo-hydrolase [Cohnella silvisoli]
MNESIKAVTELANGWLQVKVPLPFSLKWVNAYLLPEENGWTLIDPGLHTNETEHFWLAVMSEYEIRWQDIRTIVVTHHHPDHFGMAGWFQQRTDATVYLSQVALDSANRLWSEHEAFSDELTEAFLMHGMAPELTEDMREHMRGFREKVSPQPADLSILQPGGTFGMGGVEWNVLMGEGHAPGHLIFYDSVSGWLLCGDQILPDISPNIGWMPGGDPDPLGSFLNSLQEMLPLEVKMVFPGHRDPFSLFRQRIEELIDHHEHRLMKMAEIIGNEDKSAFEVCELLFSPRLRNNAHQLRFALAETIAHLIRMERRGIVIRLESESSPEGLSRIRYRLTV